MSKSKLKVKQSYFKSFGHSPTFRKVMEKWFWIKPQRKRVAYATCEHGRVDYNRAKEKLELEHVKNDALERLNNQKATIIKLENELENADDVISQKIDEVAELKESILLAREEVKNNAN